MGFIIVFIVFFLIMKSVMQTAKTQSEPSQTASASERRNRADAAWENAARRNNESARQRAQAVRREIKEESEDVSASAQIMKRRIESRNTTILERAKENAAETEEDVTLNTMEAEHKHSERVSAAIHHHPEDVIPENMLGSIEDLMVKGYDGNLCFERDFVGEAMDMISNFTVKGVS